MTIAEIIAEKAIIAEKKVNSSVAEAAKKAIKEEKADRTAKVVAQAAQETAIEKAKKKGDLSLIKEMLEEGNKAYQAFVDFQDRLEEAIKPLFLLLNLLVGSNDDRSKQIRAFKRLMDKASILYNKGITVEEDLFTTEEILGEVMIELLIIASKSTDEGYKQELIVKLSPLFGTAILEIATRLNKATNKEAVTDFVDTFFTAKDIYLDSKEEYLRLKNESFRLKDEVALYAHQMGLGVTEIRLTRKGESITAFNKGGFRKLKDLVG